jgi:Family of unknown function (DUF5946)
MGSGSCTMTSEQDLYDELRCYTLTLRDPAFIHQHVVDAFTAQRADAHTRPIALTFALVGLYLLIEGHFSGRQVQRVHGELASRKESWPAWVLPAARGAITVADVMAAPEGRRRDEAIHAWCTSVWEAFRGNQPAVVALLRQRGYQTG